MRMAIMVSVLIVAYNDSKLLQKNLPSVRSIMEGSGYSFEIVGVDNGSHDNSGEILSKNCDQVLRLERNRFFVPAFNFGLRACRGDYVLFTCPDITWQTNVVGMIDYAKAHSRTLIAPVYYNEDGSPQYAIHNRRLGLTHVFFHMTPLGDFLDWHIAKLAIRRRSCYGGFERGGPFLVDWTGAMFIVSAEIAQGLRGSDASMPLCYHDADFCERLRAAGVKCVAFPTAKVNHLLRGTTSKDPRTSYQAASDFRTYVTKHWKRKRWILWPLVLFASVFSVSLLLIIHKTKPKRGLLTLRIG